MGLTLYTCVYKATPTEGFLAASSPLFRNHWDITRRAAHAVINLGLIFGGLPVAVPPTAERQTWEVGLPGLVLAQDDRLPSRLDGGELRALILVISLYKSTVTKLRTQSAYLERGLRAGGKILAVGLEPFPSRWVERLSHRDLTNPLWLSRTAIIMCSLGSQESHG